MPIIKPTRGIQLNRSHPLARGLVGLWLFNEGSGNKVFDLSGNENSLTFGAGAASPIWQPGQSGSSLYFDGGDNISRPSLNGPFELPVTVVALLKHDTLGDKDYIIETHDQVNYAGLRYSITANNNIQTLFGDGTGLGGGDRNNKTGTTTLAVNRWYHVAGVVRGKDDHSLYINGVDDGGTYSGTATTMEVAGELNIGWLEQVSGFFTGNIEYIYLYNRALSASEIALLYRKPFCMFEQLSLRYFSIPVIVAARRSHVGFKPIEGADRLRGLGSSSLL